MKLRQTFSISCLGAAVLLAGCDNNDNKSSNNLEGISEETVSATYEITLTNLTHNQPLSPPLVALHDKSYQAFKEGERASLGIEVMAEVGGTGQLTSDLSSHDGYASYQNGSGVLFSGKSATYEIMTETDLELELTVLTMLENTNDGFTGIGNYSIASLAEGESITITGPVWDAGTEANTETADTVPGPATGGGGAAGYKDARDDLVDKVTFHPGVISREGGLETSALNESHRFDNPAIQIQITRKVTTADVN